MTREYLLMDKLISGITNDDYNDCLSWTLNSQNPTPLSCNYVPKVGIDQCT